MKQEKWENLFAAAREASSDAVPPVPERFASRVLQRYLAKQREERAFARVSIASTTTAMLILTALLAFNFGSFGASATDEQESSVELAYAVWDPAGN